MQRLGMAFDMRVDEHGLKDAEGSKGCELA